MNVYIYMYIDIYIYIPEWLEARAKKRNCSRCAADFCMYIHTYKGMYIYTYIHVYIYVYKFIYIQICI